MRFVVIKTQGYGHGLGTWRHPVLFYLEEIIMKTWTKPEVRETEVGLEVTSYLPAEIDLI